MQDYNEKPDYGRCVAIVASASLREMIRPGALAIISPMAVGKFYRYGGYCIFVLALGTFFFFENGETNHGLQVLSSVCWVTLLAGLFLEPKL